MFGHIRLNVLVRVAKLKEENFVEAPHILIKHLPLVKDRLVLAVLYGYFLYDKRGFQKNKIKMLVDRVFSVQF